MKITKNLHIIKLIIWLYTKRTQLCKWYKTLTMTKLVIFLYSIS